MDSKIDIDNLKYLLIVHSPDQQWMIDQMKNYDDPLYNMLADKSISLSEDWDHEKTYALVEEKVLKDGTHAYLTMSGTITEKFEELAEEYGTHWFKSSETVLSEYPFRNWMVRKKWPLKEKLILHVLHFQQVESINSSINFYSQVTFRRVCKVHMFPIISGNGLLMPR